MLTTCFRNFVKNPLLSSCCCINRQYSQSVRCYRRDIRRSLSSYRSFPTSNADRCGHFVSGIQHHTRSRMAAVMYTPHRKHTGDRRPSGNHSNNTSLSENQGSQGNPTVTADAYSLVEEDLASLCDDIKKELTTSSRGPQLERMTHYHFDGAGKAFRPMIVMLMARACNIHQGCPQALSDSQRRVAVVAEMIHVASLVHDDVIDEAETRRGKASVQEAWGQRQAILTGDVIMSAASMALARLRHNDVVTILTQVLEDLVSGEFMQLGSKEDETERFNHYLKKTYKKTASLIANSCKAVAVLAQCSEDEVEYAFQYGRNIGIAFQLVDDLLDFISSEVLMGKPTAADLRLGLATAPVLFAAHQHSELNPMIMRRFSQPGDVLKARELVSKSDGVSHTQYLARQHCNEAVRQISAFHHSEERDALINITNKVLNRLK